MRHARERDPAAAALVIGPDLLADALEVLSAAIEAVTAGAGAP
ncbi:hypothetical protein [Thermocatellispora tengchongensis]